MLHKRFLITIAAFLLLSCACLLFHGLHSDMETFKTWAVHIHKNGLPNAYSIWNNYMPVYQYVMYVYGKLMGSEENIRHFIRLLKGVTLLFDFAGIWYVWKSLNEQVKYVNVLLLCLFSGAYFYNTVAWGQVDGIHSALCFMSFYYAINKKLLPAAAIYILAFNMKLQSVVFFPVLGLIFLFQAAELKSWRQLAYAIFLMVGIQVVLLIPFLMIPENIPAFWNQTVNATAKYPFVVMGANNIWYLLSSTDPSKIVDKEMFAGGLSYYTTGLLMFCTISFAAMWPLLKCVWQKIVLRKSVPLISTNRIWLVCSLIALSFFYFNTQMHERYSHPVFLFLLAYSFSTRRFAGFILFSAAYLLNMEKILKLLKVDYNAFIFSGPVIATLYTVLIIYLFYQLYRREKHPARQETYGAIN